MPLLIRLGKQECVAFGMLEVLVEYGHWKYCGAWLENGLVRTKSSHPVLSRLERWLDPYSNDHKYDLIPFDELEIEELEFIYRLMKDLRANGPSVGGNDYDSPLNEVQEQQLDAAIPAIRLYFDARKSGLEKQIAPA